MESILERKYGRALNWTITEGNEPRPVALHVILHKREYVFHWARYIYAKGANDHVLIAFPTHEVVIVGYGLDHLLADLAAPPPQLFRVATPLFDEVQGMTPFNFDPTRSRQIGMEVR